MQTIDSRFSNQYDEDYSPPVLHRRPFNKEKYCRKNKQSGGHYGVHQYNNGRCKLCGKIDPQLKHRNFEEIQNGRSSIKT